MFPVSEANFFARKVLDFGVTADIKKQRRLTNLIMVCSYRSSCLDLTVALVYCQVGGCPLRLHHVCQGEYVDMN